MRTRRLCSNLEDFKTRSREIKTWFKKKVYKDEFLDFQISNAELITRSEALKRKEPIVDSRRVRSLILDFHPSVARASRIINDVHPILTCNASTKAVFTSAPFVSFHRPKNLKDHLVRAKLRGPVEYPGPKSMQPCDKLRCQICRYVPGPNTFQDSSFKHTYFINYKFDCDSSAVIYLLICKRCKMSYVGSTINSFRSQFDNHESSLNRYERGQRGMSGEHL